MLQVEARPVLADTSAWIDHLRRGNEEVSRIIEADVLVLHEFVFGELVLGALPRGHAAAEDLRAFPFLPTISHEDVVEYVRAHRLEGSGIGWTDAHLVAAAAAGGARVLTLDHALLTVVRRLDLSAS